MSLYIHRTHIPAYDTRERARADLTTAMGEFVALVETAGLDGVSADADGHQALADRLGLTLDEFYAMEAAAIDKGLVSKR